MSNSLYQISNALVSIFEEVSNNEGELSPEQEKLLAITQEELQVKSMNYKNFLSSLNTDCDAIEVEIERLMVFKRKKEKLKAKLEQLLLDAVVTLGVEKSNGVKELNFPTFSLKTRKSSSVEITGAVDDEFKKIDVKVANLTPSQTEKLTQLLDNNHIKYKSDVKFVKKDIKDALEQGKPVLNASIVVKENLVIE